MNDENCCSCGRLVQPAGGGRARSGYGHISVGGGCAAGRGSGCSVCSLVASHGWVWLLVVWLGSVVVANGKMIKNDAAIFEYVLSCLLQCK